jgi:cyanuric acid amidohydrolase
MTRMHDPSPGCFMSAAVHRLPASGPDDVSALLGLIEAGGLDPARIVAVLGKTEGNGCVNDFTRGFASRALKDVIARTSGRSPEEVAANVALVMSGGTEGGLAPHWLVFVTRPAASPLTDAEPRLAIGIAMTRAFLPEEIGRLSQVEATAAAVSDAMRRAGIEAPGDVHYVQVKCPLLTKPRIAEAERRGRTVVTEDTYESMAHSRGASALGVAVALGEAGAGALASEAVICRDWSIWSARASTSAGIELMENQVMVLGNSRRWGGDLAIGHGVMADALDLDGPLSALAAVGIEARGQLGAEMRGRVAAVLAKAEPSRTGLIRGRRHTMLDDSDINATRHARALVGGVLAGLFGSTDLFVSGGAEHQGPDGGGPVAVIARQATPP